MSPVFSFLRGRAGGCRVRGSRPDCTPTRSTAFTIAFFFGTGCAAVALVSGAVPYHLIVTSFPIWVCAATADVFTTLRAGRDSIVRHETSPVMRWAARRLPYDMIAPVLLCGEAGVISLAAYALYSMEAAGVLFGMAAGAHLLGLRETQRFLNRERVAL